MQSRRIVAAVCVLSVIAAGSAVAHQFVVIESKPVVTETNGTASIPIELHNTNVVTVRIGDRLVIEATDSDADGRLVVSIDLARLDRGAVAVSVSSGEVTAVPVAEPIGPGNYSLIADPPAPTAVPDDTRFIVQGGETPIDTPTPDTLSVTTPTDTDDGGELNPVTDQRPDGEEIGKEPNRRIVENSTPESDGPPTGLVLVGLFGPLFPVVALTLVARSVS